VLRKSGDECIRLAEPKGFGWYERVYMYGDVLWFLLNCPCVHLPTVRLIVRLTVRLLAFSSAPSFVPPICSRHPFVSTRSSTPSRLPNRPSVRPSGSEPAGSHWFAPHFSSRRLACPPIVHLHVRESAAFLFVRAGSRVHLSV